MLFRSISSTMLRAESTTDVKVGIVGCGRVANRFPAEADVVNGIAITACFDTNTDVMNDYVHTFKDLKAYATYESMLAEVDAVYVATPHLGHYACIKTALNAGKHVLCETPMVLQGAQAKELFELAEQKGVILMEANKTAHCPAFNLS